MTQKDKNFVIAARQEYNGYENAIRHYNSHLIYLEFMQSKYKNFLSHIKDIKNKIKLLEKAEKEKINSVL